MLVVGETVDVNDADADPDGELEEEDDAEELDVPDGLLLGVTGSAATRTSANSRGRAAQRCRRPAIIAGLHTR